MQHRECELKGRIDANQVENLKAYLTPFKCQKETNKAQSSGEKKSDNAYRDRVKNWRQEYREKVEGKALSDEDEDAEEGDFSGDE